MAKKKGKGKGSKDKGDVAKEQAKDVPKPGPSEKQDVGQKTEEKPAEVKGKGKGKKIQDIKAAGDAPPYVYAEKVDQPSISREGDSKKEKSREQPSQGPWGRTEKTEKPTEPSQLQGAWRRTEKPAEARQSPLPPGYSLPVQSEQKGKGAGSKKKIEQPTESRPPTFPPGYAPPVQSEKRSKGEGAWKKTEQSTESRPPTLPPGYTPPVQPEGRGKGGGPWKKVEQPTESKPPPLPPGYAPPAQSEGRGKSGGPWKKIEQPTESRPSPTLPPGYSAPADARGRGAGRGKSVDPRSQKVLSSAPELSRSEDAAKAVQKVVTTSTSSSASQADILAERFKIQLNFQALPDRKTKSGTRGRPTRIEVNYLEMKLQKLKSTAYHYDFEVTLVRSGTVDKEPPRRLLQPAYDEFKRKYFPHRFPAFDFRKNVYSSVPLFESPSVEDILSVEDVESSRPCELKVKMQFAQCIDLTEIERYIKKEQMERPQTAIQCLDVVFRNAPSLSFTKVGRSFFTKPPRMITLGGGMELWNGIFQSAVLGEKAFLNVDVAHKSFPIAQSVINLIMELFGQREGQDVLRRPMRQYHIDELKSVIKGLKVKYEIPNRATTKRIVRVLDVISQPADEVTFNLDDGKKLTVAQYFVEEKRYQLRYPKLPCLHIGSPSKKVYVPIELCEILAGQVTNRKLTDMQTSNMIKQAATSPDIRKQKILNAVRQLNINDFPTLTEFGVQVSTDFTQVDARVLDAPGLKYQPRELVKPQGGKWRPSRFLRSSEILKWSILNLDDRTNQGQLVDFQNLLKDLAKRVGIRVENCSQFYSCDMRNLRHFRDYFQSFVRDKVQLVFVILPRFNTSDAYCQVKRIAEIEFGVLTQCIKANTMFRMSPSTVSNILLKVNAKLNGVNHELGTVPPIFQRHRCMVVGADVTHPSPEQKKQFPSVVGVTASCDLNATQYKICWRLQNASVEIIEDMEQIMIEHIRYFEQKNGARPESILFFRDGVSEGQFAQVKEKEIRAIRSAFIKVARDYRPVLTFVVVQKRHHTRFFPIDPKDKDDKGNVPPGTCVDTLITYPSKFDFYLCSHSSLQGVSRPTRYCVLENQHDFNSDDIEELTYYLCHLFTRCTRSVSYPAPTYYAHLAAFRARNYLKRDIRMDDLKNQERQYTIQPNISSGSPMFFV